MVRFEECPPLSPSWCTWAAGPCPAPFLESPLDQAHALSALPSPTGGTMGHLALPKTFWGSVRAFSVLGLVPLLHRVGAKVTIEASSVFLGAR